MRKYEVVLTGGTPLLMHWDNIEWAGAMKRWRETPENKAKSVAGDDRSPAHTWIGSVYHDANRQHVAMPVDNLMRSLMEGAVQVPVPGGKSGKTFKQQSQSGMLPSTESWPLFVDGATIPYAKVAALQEESDFDAHTQAVTGLGFSLYVKRAKIGASKHVRVRPRFDRWQLRGEIDVFDDAITTPVLTDFFRLAGKYKGLGDWRPSSPKSPGPFGRFTAKVKEA